MKFSKKIIVLALLVLSVSQVHAWSWGSVARSLWGWARSHKAATVAALGVVGMATMGIVAAYLGGSRITVPQAEPQNPQAEPQNPQAEPQNPQEEPQELQEEPQELQEEQQAPFNAEAQYFLEVDDNTFEIPYDAITLFPVLKNKLKNMQDVSIEDDLLGRAYYISLNDEVGTIKILYDSYFVPEYYEEAETQGQRDISRDVLAEALRDIVGRIKNRQWEPNFGNDKFSLILYFELMRFVARQLGVESPPSRNIDQEFSDDLRRIAQQLYQQPQ